jgi:iron complex outermembrane receptor protein
MKALALVTLLAAVPAAPAAGAPRSTGVLEEIVVTGEFRDTRLLDTPSSVSVVSLEQEQAGALKHLEEILGWLPNVNLASGASRARFVQIRGIGERGQFAEPLNPSVGLILDGVDLSGIGTTATLFDVDQIEVLRGPQGTLFGANALAGVINVTTNDPAETFYRSLVLDGGNYGARGIGAVVSGPLNDAWGYRLAGQLHRDDGFSRNRFLGVDDTNSRDERTLRGKLTWTPSETQRWTVAAGYVDVDNGYDTFSLDNDRNTLADEPGQDQQTTVYGSARLVWALSPAVTFQGTAGVSASDSDYGYDEDWTFVGFHPSGYSSTDRYLRDRTTATADLRWISGPAGRLFGDTTDWVVGVYGLRQADDLERRYTFNPEDFTSAFEMDRVAVYGELERTLTERWRAALGLRAEQHRARYRDSEGVRFRPSDDMQGGRLVVMRDLGARAMTYLSVTRGYKAGGFNISGTLDPDLREYDPEIVWNYELGLKGLWLDGRLNTRAALFTMRRDDVQVSTSITRERPDGSAEFIDFTSNAARGTNDGLELEANYQPADGLRLFASLGLLNAEFDQFVNERGENLSGKAQAHAPQYQFHVGAEYRPAPGWFLRIESEGKDQFYFSNSRREVPNRDDLRSSRYALWHASLGFEADRWSVRLWGRNLTDEDYQVRGFYFGNDPRDGYRRRGFVQLGEPQRFGVTLTVRN